MEPIIIMAHVTFSRDPITKKRTASTPFVPALEQTLRFYLPEGNSTPLNTSSWRTVRLRPAVLRAAELLAARYAANNPGKAITPTEAIAAALNKGMSALVRDEDFLPPNAR